MIWTHPIPRATNLISGEPNLPKYRFFIKHLRIDTPSDAQRPILGIIDAPNRIDAENQPFRAPVFAMFAHAKTTRGNPLLPPNPELPAYHKSTLRHTRKSPRPKPGRRLHDSMGCYSVRRRARRRSVLRMLTPFYRSNMARKSSASTFPSPVRSAAGSPRSKARRNQMAS